MSKCPNCGAAMSCGCQRRVLPNGKAGCSKCMTTSGKLKKSDDPIDPIINNATVEPK